jgi:hypothetical protein
MRSACHHAQLDVARVNVLTTARNGLTTMEHWYGLPEALFEGATVQNYPADYNYQNEQQRFAEAGRLWAQAAAPGTDHYEAVISELLSLDLTIDPTFTIYQAARDWMREEVIDHRFVVVAIGERCNQDAWIYRLHRFSPAPVRRRPGSPAAPDRS